MSLHPAPFVRPVPVTELSLPFIVPAEGVPRDADQTVDRQRTTISLPAIPARVAISLGTIAGFLALWWLVTALQLVPALFLPAPGAVAERLLRLANEGFVDATLAQHLGASLMRVFAALLAALVLGVPAGFAIGLSAVGRGILDPVVEFLRPIPPLAYLPLVIIWAGIGETAKVLVIALAMLPPIIIATASGVRAVDRNRVNVARALGATPAQVLRFVVLPSTLPALLTGTRISLGAGWSTLVAAELVAATRGVGFMIQSAANFLATDVVLAGIIVIAAVAFAFECAVRLIERTFVGWAGRG
ncbi:taurine transport system permease protein [Angulomicrobium tetraedrale]|uniref:Taurine transport system permease protein n=1 Tax=Ancylobacter tetraedralis TaxID=217068 RepID=A0A839Z2W6_9HYPH|nr:ABC transporter permease subunit [Ancylobacter tetraedralis]MBB3770002.1 taurine transport system permease protein [Ancylobacter tetraedralis]